MNKSITTKSIKYDVLLEDHRTLIKAYTADQLTPIGVSMLKEIITLNDQFIPCKSGACSERSPNNPDWMYVRALSILRKLVYNVKGVSKLQLIYGKLRNRGSKPDVKYRASGAILRHIVQELQNKGLLILHSKGRTTSMTGRALLISIINTIKE